MLPNKTSIAVEVVKYSSSTSDWLSDIVDQILISHSKTDLIHPTAQFVDQIIKYSRTPT